jgi:hypothetical protein
MSSQIDATKPNSTTPRVSDVRANFDAAKTEIEALQQQAAYALTIAQQAANDASAAASQVQQLEYRVYALEHPTPPPPPPSAPTLPVNATITLTTDPAGYTYNINGQIAHNMDVKVVMGDAQNYGSAAFSYIGDDALVPGLDIPAVDSESQTIYLSDNGETNATRTFRIRAAGAYNIRAKVTLSGHDLEGGNTTQVLLSDLYEITGIAPTPSPP